MDLLGKTLYNENDVKCLSGTEQQQSDLCWHSGPLLGQERDIQGTMSLPALNVKTANTHFDV